MLLFAVNWLGVWPAQVFRLTAQPCWPLTLLMRSEASHQRHKGRSYFICGHQRASRAQLISLRRLTGRFQEELVLMIKKKKGPGGFRMIFRLNVMNGGLAVLILAPWCFLIQGPILQLYFSQTIKNISVIFLSWLNYSRTTHSVWPCYHYLLRPASDTFRLHPITTQRAPIVMTTHDHTYISRRWKWSERKTTVASRVVFILTIFTIHKIEHQLN